MASTSSTNYSKNCLIVGAKQIVQVVSKCERYVRGENMKNLVILNEDIKQGNLMIVVVDGIIKFVGYECEPRYEEYKYFSFDKKIRANNCCILPGFVDSHTHPIWAACGNSLIHELKKKLSENTLDKVCGFWNMIVEDTKRASEVDLEKIFLKRLKSAMKTGTTFIECKTGFGLDWDNEYKVLKVLTKVNRDKYNNKPEISITYLTAHGKQKHLKSEESIQDVINNKLKKIDLLIEKKEIDVHNIDILCDQEIFSIEESKEILAEGKKIGLNINFHGNQSFRAVEMGIKIGSKAISRLEEINIEEISLVEKSETVLILLPSTTYMHRLNEPTVRKMIDRDEGCIVCLGTDFSPNSYCYSMPLIMHLACTNMKMSFNEALIASTINAAFSLGVENLRGSIEEGKRGDFVIIEAENWENIIYQFGCHDSLIKYIIINGDIVHSGF